MKIRFTLSLLLLLFVSSILFAQQKLPFQGKLIQDNVAVNGNHDLSFTIEEINWTEEYNQLFILDGFYSVVLGSVNPLPTDLFNRRSEITLQISVDGETLSPVTIYSPIAGNLSGNKQDLEINNAEGKLRLLADVFETNDAGAMVLFGANDSLNVIVGSSQPTRGLISVIDSLGRSAVQLLAKGDDSGEIKIYSKGEQKVILDVFSENNAGGMLLTGKNGSSNVVAGSAIEGSNGLVQVFDSLNTVAVEMLANGRNSGEISISDNGKRKILMDVFEANNAGAIVEFGSNDSLNVIVGSGVNGSRGLISVHDSLGNQGVVMAVDENDDGEIKIFSNGEQKVILDVFSQNDAGGMLLTGKNGTSNVVAGSANNGSNGIVQVYDTLDNVAVEIIANGTNNGEITLHRLGKKRVQLDVFEDNDAGAMLLLGINDSVNVIAGSSSNGSRGLLSVNDSLGNAAVELIADESDAGRIQLNDASSNQTIVLQGASGLIQATTVTQTSDGRLKSNITRQSGALQKILKLQGVNYTWKSDEKNQNHIGFIAQDIEKVVPEVVETNENGFKSVNYSVLVSTLVEAIKEMDSEIKALKDQNNSLSTQVKRVDNLEAELAKIKQLLLNNATSTTEYSTGK